MADNDQNNLFGGLGESLMGGIGEKITQLTGGEMDLNQLLGGLDISQLLNSDFLKKYTKVDNIQALLGKLGVSGMDFSKLLSLPAKDVDKVVNENTDFSSLQEMVTKAIAEFTK